MKRLLLLNFGLLCLIASFFIEPQVLSSAVAFVGGFWVASWLFLLAMKDRIEP